MRKWNSLECLEKSLRFWKILKIPSMSKSKFLKIERMFRVLISPIMKMPRIPLWRKWMQMKVSS